MTVTDERLAEWKALAEKATLGPWTTEKPGMDAATGFASGVIVAAVARGQGIYANPPGGSYPENDRRLIAAARTAVPSLIAEVERLREALRFYANPEVYKAHPHGPAFDRRDLSFHASTALQEPGES